jgi:vitamin B12 transporter
MRLIVLYSTFFVFSFLLVHGQNQSVDLEEVTVTDSRFERSQSKTGRSVTFISKQDIKPYLGGSMASLLSSQAGIHVNGYQSHPGTNLSYFIRGGNNRQVLVLIDGVPVSDPTQIENDFDLRQVDLSSVESIEIIRGAASSLYGSAAATAVIKITTNQPKSQSIAVHTFFGTNNSQLDSEFAVDNKTYQLNVGLGGAVHSGRVSLAEHRTSGMSAVVGEEEDPTKKQNVNAQYEVRLLPSLRINTFFSNDYFMTGYDDSFPLMDADNQFTNKSQRTSIQPKWQNENSSFVGRVSWTNVERDFDESAFPISYEGKSMDVEGVFSSQLQTNVKGLVGVNHKKQEAEFGSEVVDMNLADYFVNFLYENAGPFEAQIGARLSDHSAFGSHWTYHVNPSLYFDFPKMDIRFNTSLSTAFIAPSLYKLFDAYSGNKELKPETNQGIEVGASLISQNGSTLQLVYFDREEKNFVNYDMITRRYANSPRDFRIYGTEFLLEMPLSSNIDFSTNYTYTQHEDGQGLRIPKHKVNGNFQYDVNENTQFLTSIQYVGERDDLFESKQVILSPYWLMNLHVAHKMSIQGISFYGNVQNLLNADYVETQGYTTRGRNFSLGVSYTF